MNGKLSAKKNWRRTERTKGLYFLCPWKIEAIEKGHKNWAKLRSREEIISSMRCPIIHSFPPPSAHPSIGRWRLIHGLTSN